MFRFRFDNDKALRKFLVGQAKLKDLPFEIVEFSLKEESWLVDGGGCDYK